MPLAPVSPLPELPDSTRRSSSSPFASALLWTIALLALGTSLSLVWSLHRTNLALNARLARLEAATSPAGEPTTAADGTEDSPAAGGRLPRRAGPDQRLAALLAVAGDADRCRKLLDTLSTSECVGLGRTLVARSPAGDRNGALTAVVNALATSDPTQAVALLDAVSETVLRATLARQVAETWTARDAAGAAHWLATDGTRFLDPSAASAPMLRAVTQWSTFDPAGATRFVAAQSVSDRGPLARALAVASRAWGQADMTAALAWANGLPPADSRRTQALQGIWEGGTERDPAQAGTALRQAFFAGRDRPSAELTGTVARQWAQVDPAGAAQWALSLPTAAARGTSLYQVATVWVQGDAPAAARWAATLPAGDLRAQIWKEIVGAWDSDDPGSVGNWLGGLPAGYDHDEAVGAYLPKLEPTDPEKALAWASTVGDESLRSAQVQSVLARWVRRDAVAARNWSAAHGVPILPSRASAP